MTDSELLYSGYVALHEAHTLAGTVTRDIHDRQELGETVDGRAHLEQFRAVRERLQAAHCAYLSLEQRAAGVPAPKIG